MIGNDIVDLNLASIQSNWRRKGFLNKVFTEYEREFIMNSKIPDKTVWLFWTMKESAYKVNVQQYQNRFFTPNKIKCRLTSKSEGLVKISNEEYITKSELNPNYICTTAILERNNEVVNSSFLITDNSYSSQNKESYKQLILTISKIFNLSIKELNIRKNEFGIPELYKNEALFNSSISISHHGNYGACAILT